MSLIKEELGRALSAKELGKELDFDKKTIIKYYQELGGIRVGRRFKFFEKEVINAIQTWNENNWTSEEEWAKKGKNFLYQEGGKGLGSGSTKKSRRVLEREDKHNLFN